MKYLTQEGTAMHCYSENYVYMNELLQSEVILHESLFPVFHFEKEHEK
jgi:hypothetical protein